MKLQILFSFMLVAAARQPVAETNQGTFYGTQLHDEVNTFLGIPYAKPPVGDKRFEPPQAIEKLPIGKASHFNATAFGPACHQFMYRDVMGNEAHPATPQAEDCLTINIFVPSKAVTSDAAVQKLPVYVWSFGGGFGEGAASVPLYDPTAYRLTIFGFPNSPALTHQNLGLRDQRLALEWLRDNISAFGGDPKRIVLGGQSAGAISAHAMSYAYPSDPIATGLLLQSGTIEGLGALAHNPDFEFVRVAKAVGCQSTDRLKELACMKRVDAQQLQHAISHHTLNPFGSLYGGWPMVDNTTVFTNEEYERKGREGKFAHVPTLIGSMLNEGDGSVNWDACTGVNRTQANWVTEAIFECNIAIEARGTFLDVETYPWLRAYHGADIPILMGTYSLMRTDYTSPQTPEAARFLQKLFGAFVKDPARGLTEKYRLPTYQINDTTLIELFPDNRPTLALAKPIENPSCSK
ncbi:hypothetical protein NLG97_g1365 [Lecanicillium saksenae]|uniref:Uncharacterized protein n=1 Tax=Lecanicillium saksenae TaxID=468837 RepID=A0ACC1R6L5_9HYPO|nr:hypothetical protein NLG97_g1365 [Lecanicillium saksenae]